MKKIGKIGKLNAKANRKLAELWMARDILWCEYPWPHDCKQGMGLHNAHKKKRVEYRSEPEKLWAYEEVVRVCQSAHDRMEKSRIHTREVFNELR